MIVQLEFSSEISLRIIKGTYKYTNFYCPLSKQPDWTNLFSESDEPPSSDEGCIRYLSSMIQPEDVHRHFYAF